MTLKIKGETYDSLKAAIDCTLATADAAEMKDNTSERLAALSLKMADSERAWIADMGTPGDRMTHMGGYLKAVNDLLALAVREGFTIGDYTGIRF